MIKIYIDKSSLAAVSEIIRNNDIYDILFNFKLLLIRINQAINSQKYVDI